MMRSASRPRPDFFTLTSHSVYFARLPCLSFLGRRPSKFPKLRPPCVPEPSFGGQGPASIRASVARTRSGAAEFDGAVPLLQVQAWALPGLAVASFVATAVLPVLGDTRGVLLAGAVGAAVIGVALLLALRSHDPRTVVLGIVAAQSAAAIFSVLRARRLEGATVPAPVGGDAA